MDEFEMPNVGTGVIRATFSHHQNDLHDHDHDDVWCDDGSLDGGQNEGLNIASDLDREWRRRHDQFHTVGYRDGVTAGQQASAQEGFNNGFEKSVLHGYKWGLVRGVTSALACLPDGLKSKLVGTQETGEKFKNLYESIGSVSTQAALSLFYTETLVTESEEQEKGCHIATMPNDIPSGSKLGKYVEEFESLLEFSAVRLHSPVEQHPLG